EFRIGINIGDIVIDEEEIFGDGVNITVRLEGLAEPGGICVSHLVYEQVRDRLDVAFQGIREQSVKNIARPGRAWRSRLGVGRLPTTSLTLPDQPSIAVLPFQNISGDSEQEYFADGMVEEIITALCRIRSLFVIARNSTLGYKGQAIDVVRI